MEALEANYSSNSNNRVLLWCGIGLLMFIFIGFCNIINLSWEYHKVSVSGFDILFVGKKVLGEINFGFLATVCLIFMSLMIFVPVWLVLAAALKGPALNPKFPLVLCAICAVFGLIFVIAKKVLVSMMEIPADPFSIGLGVYLYILTGVVGAVIASAKVKQ